MEDQLLFWLLFGFHKSLLEIQLGRTYVLRCLYFRYLKRINSNNINPYLDWVVYLVFLLQYYGNFHGRTLLRNQLDRFWIQLFVFEHCILEKNELSSWILRKYKRFVKIVRSIDTIFECQQYKFLIYEILELTEEISFLIMFKQK